MIGCVGDDDSADHYRRHLAAEGIDTTGIATATGSATGSAFITVDDRGENAIVVHPGANHALTPAMIEAALSSFDGADVLLLQLECPLPAVKRAAEAAREAGATVIINPSPWCDKLRDAGVPVDVFVVNENEAVSLAGRAPDELATHPAEALAAAGCDTLVITRGTDSTLAISAENGVIDCPPPVVNPVDTVGAGDTFAGAFAVARAGGMPLREAVQFANCAGALATLQPGAQTAIPNRESILACLKE